MKSTGLKFIVVVVLVGLAAGLGWGIFKRIQEESKPQTRRQRTQAAPVEVGLIEHGPIQLKRTFSGALEAQAAFVVAPKVSGRIKRLERDLADTVERGQIVAWLDDEEYVQLVAQAEAEQLVAQATLVEATSALEIVMRELQRIEALRKRGVSSESQFDVIKAEQLTKAAKVKVAAAQVTRAKAALESAKIRLSYTKVTAAWNGGNQKRIVAERFVDEGETVSANTPLLSIVELHPITGVIFVAEKDYAQLQPGQPISLTTDAYPGKHFQGRIARIAPVFRQASRQARVELLIDNPDHRLKPGMFARATVVLKRLAQATIVPEQALTMRDDRLGVFVVSQDGKSVAWREVTVGIRDGNRVQVEGAGLTGRAVTLGQQLVQDGATITIPAEHRNVPSPKAKGDST